MNKNTEQFQWTNELLKEWAEYYIIHEGDNLLEKFIQSKSKTEQPLWEILSFSYNTGKNNIAYKASNGYFFHGTVAISDTDGMLSSVWRIHSVKRLSDGEVFSVGDSLDWMGEIKSIEIDDKFNGGMVFINNSQKSCLSTAKKAPKEEQVPIKVLGLLDGINTDNPPYGKYYTLIFNNSIPESKYQSIREAIEDVLNNKYKPWKMYQTGFTSEELLQAIRDAFDAAREVVGYSDALKNSPVTVGRKYKDNEDYINSLNK